MRDRYADCEFLSFTSSSENTQISVSHHATESVVPVKREKMLLSFSLCVCAEFVKPHFDISMTTSFILPGLTKPLPLVTCRPDTDV